MGTCMILSKFNVVLERNSYFSEKKLSTKNKHLLHIMHTSFFAKILHENSAIL